MTALTIFKIEFYTLGLMQSVLQAEQAGLLRSLANKSFSVLRQMPRKGRLCSCGDLSHVCQWLVWIESSIYAEGKKENKKEEKGQR